MSVEFEAKPGSVKRHAVLPAVLFVVVPVALRKGRGCARAAEAAWAGANNATRARGEERLAIRGMNSTV